jgi:hypothetical protein
MSAGTNVAVGVVVKVMIHRLTYLGTVALLAAACTSMSRLQTATAPSSSVAELSASLLGPTRCPARIPYGHNGGFDEETGEQANLVVEYGHIHRDEFMGNRIVSVPGGYGLRAFFSGHLAEHERAIRSIIGPTRPLEIAPATHTPAEVVELAGDLANWQSIHGVVDSSLPHDMELPVILITMPPGGEEEADRLIAKYGDLVSIEISYKDYVPEGCGLASLANPCSSQAWQAELPPTSPTVTATLEMPVSFGQSAEAGGSLRVTNSGSTDLAIYGSSGGLGGWIIDPASGNTVGEFRGAFPADLNAWLFSAGTTSAIPARVSAMACGGSALSLKPGKYLARVQVGLSPPRASSDPAGLTGPTVAVSAETAISITSS